MKRWIKTWGDWRKKIVRPRSWPRVHVSVLLPPRSIFSEKHSLSMNASPSHSHMCAHVTFISASTLTPTWESRELVIVCYSHQWCACSSLCCVVTQSCPLCNPMDCSPPGSSVHGVSQARIPEWVAISSCRGSSDPETEPVSPASPALAGGFFTIEPQGKFRSKSLCWQVPEMAMQQLSFPTIYLCEAALYFDCKHISQKMKCRSWYETRQPSSYLLLRLIHERDLQNTFLFFFFLLYSRSFLAIYFF